VLPISMVFPDRLDQWCDSGRGTPHRSFTDRMLSPWLTALSQTHCFFVYSGMQFNCLILFSTSTSGVQYNISSLSLLYHARCVPPPPSCFRSCVRPLDLHRFLLPCICWHCSAAALSPWHGCTLWCCIGLLDTRTLLLLLLPSHSRGFVAAPLSHILVMLHLMHGELNENRKVSFFYCDLALSICLLICLKKHKLMFMCRCC
jgi:hypothetical protein